ncbi:MAG: hypothetical protein J5I65_16265 [Aridibacter famidurans]|nr:hypothetical protein [Aridibacter famidurans]
MSEKVEFDEKEPASIEAHAKKLLNKSLRDVEGDHKGEEITALELTAGKGKLGIAVEQLHFGYSPNSNKEPDFSAAGVELKTTPLKKTQKGLRSKERLVLSLINYFEVVDEDFENSSFKKKNSLLLLLFYLYSPNVHFLDYVFKLITLWEFPEQDLVIIRRDWETIVDKVRRGKAHEISEGDTFYLGACTKGANASSLREQPYADEDDGTQKLAPQRALALKSRYLNLIIDEKLDGAADEIGSVVKSSDDISKAGSLETLILEKFTPYVGQSAEELLRKFDLEDVDAKHRYYLLSSAILGLQGKKIAEFEKAGIEVKTVRLKSNGVPKESMSFKNIDFDDILEEEWLESYWYETLTSRFFFVIFQFDKEGVLRFKGVKFWTMPYEDLLIAENFWTDTKEKIGKGDFDHFIKTKDKRVCHVRPKARKASDKVQLKDGTWRKKMAYWLNAKYIASIVAE